MAGQPTSSKPQVIAPKGLGPFFWPYTLLLTVISLVIAGGILFANLDWLLPGWSNPVTDRAGDVDNLFKFMGVFGAWIFIYVAGYVVYFAVVFRRRADEPANYDRRADPRLAQTRVLVDDTPHVLLIVPWSSCRSSSGGKI